MAGAPAAGDRRSAGRRPRRQHAHDRMAVDELSAQVTVLRGGLVQGAPTKASTSTFPNSVGVCGEQGGAHGVGARVSILKRRWALALKRSSLGTTARWSMPSARSWISRPVRPPRRRWTVDSGSVAWMPTVWTRNAVRARASWLPAGGQKRSVRKRRRCGITESLAPQGGRAPSVGRPGRDVRAPPALQAGRAR